MKTFTQQTPKQTCHPHLRHLTTGQIKKTSWAAYGLADHQLVIPGLKFTVLRIIGALNISRCTAAPTLSALWVGTDSLFKFHNNLLKMLGTLRSSIIFFNMCVHFAFLLNIHLKLHKYYAVTSFSSFSVIRYYKNVHVCFRTSVSHSL
jgi:hypothetical protein